MQVEELESPNPLQLLGEVVEAATVGLVDLNHLQILMELLTLEEVVVVLRTPCLQLLQQYQRLVADLEMELLVLY